MVFPRRRSAHRGAVLGEKRHQNEGLRAPSRPSWVSPVRHRYTTATTWRMEQRIGVFTKPRSRNHFHAQ